MSRRALQSVDPRTEGRADRDEAANQTSLAASTWLTRDEAVAYLKLKSRFALYRRMRERRLPGTRKDGTLKFHRATLDAWMLDNSPSVAPPRRGAARGDVHPVLVKKVSR